ncbi:15-hydroxyprostaglandin dehydrogenase [NAD(+)] isoform X5 [Pieris rapae]|uniref:15-hydroxyprostaglandin dehydrogenase [NAD(+)] isoform X5 n=1 Tax=Pieris rapae TaxID=64459 RepID=UPI001E2814FB|nr:15-hydroxyprostaglandin dehydrogenase [NAD(+)] isoform X5 [Pieris rapae]
MYNLKDKIVFITGGATGIGAIAVKLFLEEGAKHVTITDVNLNAGKQLEKELETKFKGRVKFVKCDVRNDEELFDIYKKIIDDHGFIDVVINNAGIMNDSPDVYRTALNVNINALMTSTLKARELMRTDRSGRGGIIMNISSIAALMPNRFMPIYCAAKSAVLQFSICIGAQENYEKTGVKVMTMCYGATDTSLLSKEKIKAFDEELSDELWEFIKQFPLQSANSAATGLIDACKRGDSGSIWLVNDNKPAEDITPVVIKAYGLLTDLVV